jgi:UDP-N-acetylmuramate dehydrogenase
MAREQIRAELRDSMEEYKRRRRATQPLNYPSAGSVFKRPVGHFAGKLIEDCQLKGTTHGGAQISPKHAGFIVNLGGATAEDVCALIELAKRNVKEQFDVALEEEIILLRNEQKKC